MRQNQGSAVGTSETKHSEASVEGPETPGAQPHKIK